MCAKSVCVKLDTNGMMQGKQGKPLAGVVK